RHGCRSPGQVRPAHGRELVSQVVDNRDAVDPAVGDGLPWAELGRYGARVRYGLEASRTHPSAGRYARAPAAGEPHRAFGGLPAGPSPWVRQLGGGLGLVAMVSAAAWMSS